MHQNMSNLTFIEIIGAKLEEVRGVGEEAIINIYASECINT